MKYKHHIAGAAVALLMFLFVYTGTSKLYSRSVFELQLKSFPYINGIAVAISWWLPFIELFTAVLLFVPKLRIAGLYASVVLLALFTGYLSLMRLSQSHLPCTCGGVLTKMSWGQHIFFNLFFIILSIAGIALSARRTKHHHG